MTWIIGAAPALGAYGLMLSDIQVTTADGMCYDILRKAYPVGPFMAGGFAGSVQLGFELLESVAALMRLPHDAPQNSAWHPSSIAEHWAPIAREIFGNANPVQQNLGSQFILVGVDPVEDVIPGRAMPYVCKFSWPEFEPEIFRGINSIASIGSGASVDSYMEGMRQATSFDSGLIQAEVGNTGGWAMALNIVTTSLLESNSVPGISPYIHYHQIERGRFKFGNNNRNIFPREEDENQSITEIRMPTVAQSYQELLAMLNQIGCDSSTASC